MGDCVNVKSLDNRAGCYVLIEALRAIKASRKKPSCNFVAAFTVQEEVGLRGAQAGTLDIQPDFSIALDVTIACDIPGTPAHDQVSHLGAGAAIKLYDGSVIADRRMVKFMKAMADSNKINGRRKCCRREARMPEPCRNSFRAVPLPGPFPFPPAMCTRLLKWLTKTTWTLP